MAILFVNNSPVNFGGRRTTATNERDVNFSPYGIISSVGNAVIIDPLAAEVTAAAGDLWTHFRMRTPGDFNDTNADGYLVSYRDSATNVLSARIDFTDGDLFASAIGDTTVNGATFPLADITNYDIDCRVSIGGGNITVDLYVNGVLASTAVAANTGAKPIPTRIVWDLFDAQDISAPADMYFSEFIITDGEDTRGWRLATLQPAAAGFHTAWTGDFNELSDQDKASSVQTSTNNDRMSSTLTAYAGGTPPTGIRAVCAGSAVQRGPTGLSQLTQFVRIAGTDYDGSAVAFATGEQQRITEVWDNNPNTAVPWVVGDLAALEVGLLANT